MDDVYFSIEAKEFVNEKTILLREN